MSESSHAIYEEPTAMTYLNVLRHFIANSLFLAILVSTTLELAQCSKPLMFSLENICNMTRYPTICYSTLSPMINSKNPQDSGILYDLSVQVAKRELLIASKKFVQNGKMFQPYNKADSNGKTRVQLAIQSCRQILDIALYHLNRMIPANGRTDFTKAETRENFRTWVSSVASLVETCKDEFSNTPRGLNEVVAEQLDKSTKTVSNSLAILCETIRLSDEDHSLNANKTKQNEIRTNWNPTWLSDEDRMFLEGSKVPNGSNVVVAADGSGNYRTITEAINAVPPNNNQRFIIYVKRGTYIENVVVGVDKWNVAIFGDGMDNTIVSGNRNMAGGTPTFQTATFSVYGSGFFAQNIAFVNTAGPKGAQAVAMTSVSDRSVFYRCRFEGYQDTLYTHSMQQFYRECKISGTIDFIFGHAAVVIQNSWIYVRRPLPGQSNVITAQGKTEPGSNSATTIQNCQILNAEDLTGVSSYLGRPYDRYSTVVFMESNIGGFIHPQGWMEWLPGVTPANTIYYGEYMNTGAGAGTLNRVNWGGVHRSISAGEASRFTVRSLIHGLGWIPETRVPFKPDL